MKAQKSKQEIQSVIILSAVCCLLSGIFSCGYAVHGRSSLPFHEIRIESIENRTDEPKLQDKLYKSLTDEFLSRGIAVSSGAAYSLRGRITLFELRILAESADVAAEYEIIMKGDFTVADSEGNIREIKGIGAPFLVSFAGAGNLSALLSFRELASEKAVRDMARQIVAGIIYR